MLIDPIAGGQNKQVADPLLAISSSFTTVGALEIQPLSDILQKNIEKSPIHFALFKAHETGDLTLLNRELERGNIEIQTEKSEIFTYGYNPTYDISELTHGAFEDGITPLEYAIRLQNPALVNLLIKSGAKCDSIRFAYKTWVSKGLTLSYPFPHYKYSYTPLYAALMLGNTEIIKLLLDAGANQQNVFETKILIGRHPLPDCNPIFSDIIYSAQMIADYQNLGELSSLRAAKESLWTLLGKNHYSINS